MTKPGATATIKVVHGFGGRTDVAITANDSTESFLTDGRLVAPAKPILPYWLALVKGTNAHGTLASFSVPTSEWKTGAIFRFENREGDPHPMMRNCGSATFEICRRSDDGPCKGCTSRGALVFRNEIDRPACCPDTVSPCGTPSSSSFSFRESF